MRPRMPVLFIGHGSPMNAVAKNDYTRFLAGLARELPPPRAILAVSAHWETEGTQILGAAEPRTIHDFGGFPRELYEISYPARGDQALTTRAASLTGAAVSREWGLDHGTWTVLHHLFPAASLPVVQLSLDRNLTPRGHYELARKLKPLREEGILVLASGNVTHNLRELEAAENAPAAPWAKEFDERIRRALTETDLPILFGEKERDELWRRAHPRLDHYLPLLYALGAGEDSGPPSFPFEGFQHGTLSMRQPISRVSASLSAMRAWSR
jgi:4,5-DOPA dioxygenase extradiol